MKIEKKQEKVIDLHLKIRHYWQITLTLGGEQCIIYNRKVWGYDFPHVK